MFKKNDCQDNLKKQTLNYAYVQNSRKVIKKCFKSNIKQNSQKLYQHIKAQNYRNDKMKNHKTLSFDLCEKKVSEHEIEIKKELEIFRREIEEKFLKSEPNKEYRFPLLIKYADFDNSTLECNKCIA